MYALCCIAPHCVASYCIALHNIQYCTVRCSPVLRYVVFNLDLVYTACCEPIFKLARPGTILARILIYTRNVSERAKFRQRVWTYKERNINTIWRLILLQYGSLMALWFKSRAWLTVLRAFGTPSTSESHGQERT